MPRTFLHHIHLTCAIAGTAYPVLVLRGTESIWQLPQFTKLLPLQDIVTAVALSGQQLSFISPGKRKRRD